MQASTSHGGIEARAAARTNLFLAATMQSGGIGHPVKVRDLSASGARIETPHVFEVNDAVTLIRGRLSVDARVSWRAERFCGLSFASSVSIKDWMANPVNVQRERKPTRVAAEGELAMPLQSEAKNAGSIADELTRVSSWLTSFGQTLANDPQVVFKHGTELFSLGLAARALAVLAETMQGDSSKSGASTGGRI